MLYVTTLLTENDAVPRIDALSSEHQQENYTQELEPKTLKTSAMKYVRLLVPYRVQFVCVKMAADYKINIQII